ncbi:MAG: hypothetical protein Q9P14_09250 [candidate division KSB1 bacterium]|nr:hypothetical protein [candidate division KSB1 bacterium]MDQ7064142.1 hypothetical protein [candidate division KSB1 bacterium]
MQPTRLINAFIAILIWLLAAGLAGCDRDISGTPTNLPPETHLSIFLGSPEAIVDTSSSQLVLHWWGDDPDGLVIGFVYSFYGPPSLNDTVDASGLKGFTTQTSDTFHVPVGPRDTTFTFYISAVDDKWLIDPTPAKQAFPVRNSPPSVSFRLNSLPTDTTFAVVTFLWNGSDIDGKEDIAYYEYALNPPPGGEIPWRRLPPEREFVSLTPDSGLRLNADNVFMLRAVDRGQAYSPTLVHPDSGKVWYVRDKVGDILFVDDFTNEDNALSRAYFSSVLQTLGQPFSIYDLARDGLPATLVDFTETLKLFKTVIWWADGSPTLAASQQALIRYLAADGHLLLTGFEGAALRDRSRWVFNFRDSQDSLLTFLPIIAVSDTVGREIRRILQGTTFEALVDGYPALPVAKGTAGLTIIGSIFGLYPAADGLPLYQLPPASTVRGNVYPGEPIIGIISRDRRIILLEFPLTKIDAEAAAAFLRKAFEDFGL